MFFFTYLRRELRRRIRQTVVTALGLAVGVGLVVTVIAVTTGVGDAQAAVLRSLYGIGTDVTVTTEPPPAPKPNSPEADGGFFTPGAAEQHLDLLGLPPGLGPLDAASVARIGRQQGVRAVAGGLSLIDTNVTVPAADALPPGKPPKLPTTFAVEGVDVGHTGLGPYASGELTKGRNLTKADASAAVAVVDSGYAKANELTVGGKVTVAGTEFEVVGIVRQPQGGGAAEVYLPLARAQAMAKFQNLPDLTGKVNKIYVAADDAAAVPALRDRIEALLPSATVTSADSLAGAVSGSLASAADLAGRLGRWLAVAGLVAAFAVTALLTMASVARRVREFGTLKALGWRGRRIVGQVVGESAVVGVLGAALGIAVGFGGAALVTALAPPVSATVAQNPGSTPAESVSINGSGMHHGVVDGATHTISVQLTAPVTLTAVALAVGLAIAGGLAAGTLGGWRAARLRPTTALGRVD